MLVVTKWQTCRFTLTLSEMMNELMPRNWLFVLKAEQSQGQNNNDNIIEFLNDISGYPNSFNRFEFKEGVDLVFGSLGFWNYSIYQMPDTLDKDFSRGKLVERGKIKVFGNDVEKVFNKKDNNVVIYGKTNI